MEHNELLHKFYNFHLNYNFFKIKILQVIEHIRSNQYKILLIFMYLFIINFLVFQHIFLYKYFHKVNYQYILNLINIYFPNKDHLMLLIMLILFYQLT